MYINPIIKSELVFVPDAEDIQARRHVSRVTCQRVLVWQDAGVRRCDEM